MSDRDKLVQAMETAYVQKEVGILTNESQEQKVIKTLYHGSISGLKGKPSVTYSNRLCDFGNGFYLGEFEEQAKNRVCNYPKPKVYKCELEVISDVTYIFKDDTLWALYVANCRNMFDFSKYKKLIDIFNDINKHSVIVGYIADDKISDVYDSFIEGNLPDLALQDSLKLVKYGNQYVIKDQKYCDEHLKIIKEHSLSDDEKIRYKKWGDEIRFDIKGKLDTIKAQYRRNLKCRYFDEIIEDYR